MPRPLVASIESSGLKNVDGKRALAPLTVLTGDPGTGKSGVLDAFLFAVLGHFPQRGKTEAATAGRMHGLEMQATVTLTDGRSFGRSLVRDGKSLRGEAFASWMPEDASQADIGVAIESLFAEADLLDIRLLLAAPPQQRAARFDALLDASSTKPAEKVALVDAWATFRLAEIGPERIPADTAEATKAALGVDVMLTPGQRQAHKASMAKVGGVLAEQGVAEALAFAKSEKNAANLGARAKETARKEYESRAQGAEVPAKALVEIEAEARTVGDRLAVLTEKTAQAKASAKARADAQQARDEALAALDKLKEGGTADERARALNEQAKGLRAEADAIADPAPTTPPLMAEEDGAKIEEALQAEDAARGLEQQADGLAIPVPVPASMQPEPAVDGMAVERARRELDLAKQSPWSVVRECAEQIVGLTVPQEQKPRQAEIVRLLAQAADKHGGDLETLTRGIEVAEVVLRQQEQALAKVRRDNAERARQNAAANARWEAVQNDAKMLRAQAGEKRKHATSLRDADAARVKRLNAEAQQAYATAEGVRKATVKANAEKRLALHQQADRVESDARRLVAVWTAAAAKCAETQARVEGMAAVKVVDVTEAEAEAVVLQASLRTLSEQKAAVEGAEARRRELASLTQQMEAAQAGAKAWTAIEWALQRLRERDLAGRGAPIIERMTRFLQGAGRAEVPYLRAGKGKVEVGWIRDGQEIQIEDVSGGEMVLMGAALASALVALRKPEVPCLLIEAAESGRLVESLMAGCEAVGEDVGNVVVATCFPVAARKGWKTLALRAAETVGASS